MAMRVVLEVVSGPEAGRAVSVPAGPPLRVGRREDLELALTRDPALSRLHFALEFDGRTCRLRDLGSRYGTMLNGRRAAEASLRDGDQIEAGNTTFRVRIERPLAPLPELASTAAPAPAPRGPADPLHRRVWQELRQVPQPLHAVLDAARNPLIYARLLECPEPHQSLYEGAKGETLALVAPYLVALPPDSPFLVRLIEEGWGKSWGIYLTCDRPFAEVRKHLRRFLVVRTEEGRELLFRYYDPRVLRPYLPTCTPDELARVFGPIGSFLVESADRGGLLRFEREGPRLRVQEVRPEGPAASEQLTRETAAVAPARPAPRALP
jgi:pSer/pThr/pTyr-binding forkhead associated (FHA) protein